MDCHKKEWNLAIFDNMDGLRGYYAKWNKSNREKQIPYDLYVESEKQNKLMNITEQTRLIDAKNKQVVARGKRIGQMIEIGEGE